jgi:hypothetical protein
MAVGFLSLINQLKFLDFFKVSKAAAAPKEMIVTSFPSFSKAAF